MSPPSEQLPFSEERQDAILGHLLTKETLFRQTVDIIKPSWFMDGLAFKVWESAVNWWGKYNYFPSLDEIRASETWRLETQQLKVKLGRKLEQTLERAGNYRWESLKEELTNWLRARAYQDATNRSTDLFNAGKFDESYAVMDSALKYIASTTFENNLSYDFTNWRTNFERRQLEFSNALSFGSSTLDRLLLPIAKGNGSLLRGDTTIILAGQNVGKTTAMVTVAAHNILQGKHVLFLTHEGVDDDIAEKVMCSILNVNKDEMMGTLAKTPEGAAQIDQAAAYCKRYLVYIANNKAGNTVEEVASLIRREQEKRLTSFGRGFDMLIDDYPAKLGSRLIEHGVFQKRNVDEYVYNHFIALALELKFHALLAIQANRDGNRVNSRVKTSRGSVEDRLLIPEDVHESFGPMQGATNIITGNRGPEDERLGYITWYLAKSRSSSKGWAVCCKSNYNNAITHSDSLGCTFYRGNAPLGDQVEEMFRSNMNIEIPDAYRKIRDGGKPGKKAEDQLKLEVPAPQPVPTSVPGVPMTVVAP